MTARFLPAAGLTAIAFLACGAPDGERRADSAVFTAAQPVSGIHSAYGSTAAIRLPARAPLEAPGLVNVFRLSPNVFSGSEPAGERAFEQLAHWGVRTIVSVDGKVPDAAAAATHGMATVHLPIRYSGLTSEQLRRLAKVFREARAPFYVHCFHGRHRGPAAAGVGRLILDGASREQVVAEMGQWCGTSPKYAGLFALLSSAPIPPASETEALAFAFPSACRPEGLRGAMTEIARVFDGLELLGLRGFESDPEHPDLDALNEARRLVELFEVCAESAQAEPRGLGRGVEDSLRASRDLERFLSELRGGREEALRGAEEALDSVADDCASCHRAHRNRR
ncbi:MAG: hypothetical protein CMJ84_15820 [Planctomycetes bacterium]|jgi:protein tyrosine phosphatase (PTP) superfamily phosphohydrolase (DUF442 family)|nr:hypothetical protein [Planctomycetota bacterium]MDP6410456.1 hypothetical protein [Planctomycetota bacterium]